MGHWVRMLMVLTLIRCGGHDEKKEKNANSSGENGVVNEQVYVQR